MCGIVGYAGRIETACGKPLEVCLQGLRRLEYRGYDSAGIAVRDGDSPVQVVKAKGRLKVLAEKTNDGQSVIGTCGIGHTRWATHGEPSETNAHPHISDDYNVVGVHNGIIENYQELRDKLTRNGYSFYSSTDTEVAVKLIDYYYKKYEHTPVDAINHAMVRIRGSYAFAIMFNEYPGEIYVARKDSPMILGVNGVISSMSAENFIKEYMDYNFEYNDIQFEQPEQLNKEVPQFDEHFVEQIKQIDGVENVDIQKTVWAGIDFDEAALKAL